MFHSNYYWKWDGAIPSDQCDLIVKSANWDASEKGQVKTKDEIKAVDKIRKTQVVWADQLSPIGCILQTFALTANAFAGWNFHVRGLEKVQLGKYSKGAFYKWHTDTGSPDEAGMQRKLSIVAMLSDASEYEGGLLEIKNLQEPLKKLNKGDIICFPSYLEHQVTEVTDGERYTAVAWCHGNAFR